MNEAAFKAEGVEDVLSFNVAEKPIPKMVNAQLTMVLKKILSRVPVECGVTYILRGQCVEVTTTNALRAELGIPAERRLWPLVNASFAGESLEEALSKLARLSEITIVLDPRAAKAAKTTTTAKLTNASVDSAVRLLADMADLKSVIVENMIYVTTKENADRLKGELDKRAEEESSAGGMVGGTPGAGGLGGGGLGGGGLGGPGPLPRIPGKPRPMQ